MKKEQNQAKDKKIKKWILHTFFLILFGTSAIINIAYLPKYFTLKNHQAKTNGQILNINISAYDENNKQLISFHYQTILTTLGDLMAQDSDTYTLIDYKPWGRYLSALNYYDENNKKQTKKETSSAGWTVYYINNGNEEISPIGIDLFYLHNNEKIKLYYSTFN